MPPKKKGTTKANPAATTARSTRATAVVDKRGKEYETTAAAARPPRQSVGASSSLAADEKTAQPKKRAQPAKAAATTSKTGRNATAATTEISDVPKKRGRPPKKASVTAPAQKTPAETANAPAKRGPGRPPKKAAATPAQKSSAAGRKRGRSSEQAVPDDEEPPPKRRGRPPKGGETTQITADDGAAAEQLEDELLDEADDAKQTAPSRKAKGKARASDTPLQNDEKAPDSEGDKQFWLMKAEQDGHDVQLKDGSVFNTTFTIDDLRSKTEPEAWDGVRNVTAAKNMRSMKRGDLAFFYASGGKSGRKPGIVGIMEIVREHEPDATVSDEKSYGYVEKEKDRGKWCVVHVEFRKKLSKPVFLSELQKFSKQGGALSDMQEFNAARLSVSKVSQKEWDFIINNLVDGYDDESAAYAKRPKVPKSPGFPDGIEEADEAKANDMAAAEAAIMAERLDNGDLVVERSTVLEKTELATVASPPFVPSTEDSLTSDGLVPPATSDTFALQAASSFRPASRARSRTPKIGAAAVARSLTPMELVQEEVAELAAA